MTNPANARIGTDGAVWLGDANATVPASLVASLTGYVDLGGMAEDSLELSLPDGGDKEVFRFWQNMQVVRVRRSPSEDLAEIKFTMAETTKHTLGLYWGVTIATAGNVNSWTYSGGLRPYKRLVVDVFDDTGDDFRLFAPKAYVTSVESVPIGNAGLTGWGVTVECEVDHALGYALKGWADEESSS